MVKQDIKTYIDRIEALMPRFMKTVGGDQGPELEEEITIAQLKTLYYVSSHESCRMTDISHDFGVTLSNMTSMVDRLIEGKYLLREDDPNDRRIVRIKLSQKGENIVKKFEEHRRRHAAKFLQKMSEEEIESLIKIMAKILKISEGEG